MIRKEKFELLEKVRESSKFEIHFIRQKEPLGLGNAVLCAKKFIGDEPFAVLLDDDIVQAEIPCLRQLINQYDETGASVIGIQQVPDNETNRYGIIAPLERDGRLYKVNNFVEKPAMGTAPSNLAIIGRYILTPKIFAFLEKQGAGAGGEIQLTDAIEQLNQIQRVFAYDFEGKRYDVGEKIGFVKTTVEFALQHKELRDELLVYLEGILDIERVVR